MTTKRAFLVVKDHGHVAMRALLVPLAELRSALRSDARVVKLGAHARHGSVAVEIRPDGGFWDGTVELVATDGRAATAMFVARERDEIVGWTEGALDVMEGSDAEAVDRLLANAPMRYRR